MEGFYLFVFDIQSWETERKMSKAQADTSVAQRWQMLPGSFLVSRRSVVVNLGEGACKHTEEKAFVLGLSFSRGTSRHSILIHYCDLCLSVSLIDSYIMVQRVFFFLGCGASTSFSSSLFPLLLFFLLFFFFYKSSISAHFVSEICVWLISFSLISALILLKVTGSYDFFICPSLSFTHWRTNKF